MNMTPDARFSRARRIWLASMSVIANARKNDRSAARFRPAAIFSTAAGVVLLSLIATIALADLPAFPGALGQGAAATGGRGGDVYHVTTLDDYANEEDVSEIKGSLRHGIRSAKGPRTIVFDVGGAIQLKARLEIRKNDITIAGQTAPGGITLWGYPVEVTNASNVIIRYLRMRTGDFNARAPAGSESSNVGGHGAKDLDAGSANGFDVGRSNLIILDHLSSAWGMDETLSVTLSRNVTVQNSIIAESLNKSFHPKGPHGYGTLIRGDLTAEDQKAGIEGYTFYGNLWAQHRARNPSIGGQQRLNPGQAEKDRHRTDVNIVNNVVYGWGEQPTHRSDLGEVRINLVGNYFVNGPAKKSDYIFNEANPAGTQLFQQGNMHDADQDSVHDGKLVGRAGDIRRTFRQFDRRDELTGPAHGEPFNFFSSVAKSVVPAEEAYRRVVRSAGASIFRDAVDDRIIDALVHRSGVPIDSQEIYRDSNGVIVGIDGVRAEHRPDGFDSDGDGMPDGFEGKHSLNPGDPADGNGTSLSESGYTNLEVYLNGLIPGANSQ
jgi:hypothetical protein